MKFDIAIFGVLMLAMAMFSTILVATMIPNAVSDTDDYIHTKFKWSNTTEYELYLTIPVADVEGYRNSMIPRMYCPIAADRFIIEDTTIREIAEKFNDMTIGRSDEYRVNFVNVFVHKCIEYVDDQIVHHHREYFQYPVETLLLRTGDCEDMSILCVSILRAMGYDSILLATMDHCMVGVNIDANGRYTDVLDQRYYHLEPTTGGSVGVSDCEAFPNLPIYKFIAFAIFMISMILCLMAFSGILWGEDDS